MPAFTPTYVPQTELDAVNQILLSIGQSPVNTLEVAGIKDVNVARQVLHNTLRETLTRGFDFNTDDDYTLAKDVDGKVAIPPSALKCDPCDVSKRYVERVDSVGNTRRFYDRDNHTFVLNEDVKVDVVWFFPFSDIPQAARAYIAHKAGRVFQAGAVGSQILYAYTKEREVETLAELERSHLQTLDANFFANDTMSSLIFRRDRNYR
jgi:hypothetical protein